MFLLKLLGCRTSYNLIFCQFWLFFVFKLLLSFFWLCEEAQCVYLHLHLGWKSLPLPILKIGLFFATELHEFFIQYHHLLFSVYSFKHFFPMASFVDGAGYAYLKL